MKETFSRIEALVTPLGTVRKYAEMAAALSWVTCSASASHASSITDRISLVASRAPSRTGREMGRRRGRPADLLPAMAEVAPHIR